MASAARPVFLTVLKKIRGRPAKTPKALIYGASSAIFGRSPIPPRTVLDTSQNGNELCPECLGVSRPAPAETQSRLSRVPEADQVVVALAGYTRGPLFNLD